MRIGICSYWFNRGQGVVARQLRSALDSLGHETFVLARPTKETFRQPRTVETGDVWAQREVTPASTFEVPARELVEWREESARVMDRPAGFVLPDQALVEIARRLPGSLADLEHIRALPPQTLHRRGERILQAVQARKHAVDHRHVIGPR